MDCDGPLTPSHPGFHDSLQRLSIADHHMTAFQGDLMTLGHLLRPQLYSGVHQYSAM